MVINNLFHFSTFEAFHCTFYFNTFEALHCHFWTQVFTSAHKLPYLTRLWFTNCVTVANIKWAAHRFINPIWLSSTSSWIHSSYNNVAGMTFFYNEFHHFLSDWRGFNWHSWTHYSFSIPQLSIPQLTIDYLSRCEILLWKKIGVHSIIIRVSLINQVYFFSNKRFRTWTLLISKTN